MRSPTRSASTEQLGHGEHALGAVDLATARVADLTVREQARLDAVPAPRTRSPGSITTPSGDARYRPRAYWLPVADAQLPSHRSGAARQRVPPRRESRRQRRATTRGSYGVATRAP